MILYRELSNMQMLPLGICGVLMLTAALLILVNSCVMQFQWKYRVLSGVLALTALFLLQGLADATCNLEFGDPFSFLLLWWGIFRGR